MEFVKPDMFHRAGLSIGQDHGLADQIALRLLESVQDRRCTELRNRHGCLRGQARNRVGAALFAQKDAQLVTG